MIELFDWAVPDGVEPYPLDFGGWLQPATGAEATRIDRKGARFGATVSLPPMDAQEARQVVSRILGAQFGEVLKIEWPLLEVSQGSPGAPVVSGAGQAGTSLDIEGVTPGYAFREGYWLTIVDENARGYLHNCRSNLRVGGDGLATIEIAPALRWPFLDGATIRLGLPTIEGKVPAAPWQVTVDRLVRVGFGIEELA